MNGTATHEWTVVYDASHRSYVEDKLSKNYFAPPPIGKTLKISPPKVEKPKYGIELYHKANFNADQREISVPGQKYIFFLIEAPIGAIVPAIHFWKSLVDM